MQLKWLIVVFFAVMALFNIVPANAEPPTTEVRKRIMCSALSEWAHAAIEHGRSATIVQPHDQPLVHVATTASDHVFAPNTNGLFITIVFGNAELEENAQSTRCLYIYYTDGTNECLPFNRSTPTFGFLDFDGPFLDRLVWEPREPTEPSATFFYSTTWASPLIE